MARFTKPGINWKELEKLVPPDQKAKFMSFKGKSDGYLRRVNENPPEPPAIDWEFYKKAVPIQGLVAKFEESYKKLKVPYPENKLSAQVDAQWASLQKEVENFCAERDKEIEAANKELKRIEAVPSYESMTMEMFYEFHPEMADDFINKPTFWPHTPEEQLGYVDPAEAAQAAADKKH